MDPILFSLQWPEVSSVCNFEVSMPFSSISRVGVLEGATLLHLWYISTVCNACQIKDMWGSGTKLRGARTLSGFACLSPKAPLLSPWPPPIGKKPFRGQMPFRFLSLMSQKQRRKTSPSHLCHSAALCLGKWTQLNIRGLQSKQIMNFHFRVFSRTMRATSWQTYCNLLFWS